VGSTIHSGNTLGVAASPEAVSKAVALFRALIPKRKLPSPRGASWVTFRVCPTSFPAPDSCPTVEPSPGFMSDVMTWVKQWAKERRWSARASWSRHSTRPTLWSDSFAKDRPRASFDQTCRCGARRSSHAGMVVVWTVGARRTGRPLDPMQGSQRAHRCQRFSSHGASTFFLAGELDVGTAPLLSDTIRAAVARGGPITLDLSNMTFIDSAGVQTRS
jgi:hypothetical protein